MQFFIDEFSEQLKINTFDKTDIRHCIAVFDFNKIFTMVKGILHSQNKMLHISLVHPSSHSKPCPLTSVEHCEMFCV